MQAFSDIRFGVTACEAINYRFAGSIASGKRRKNTSLFSVHRYRQVGNGRQRAGKRQRTS